MNLLHIGKQKAVIFLSFTVRSLSVPPSLEGKEVSIGWKRGDSGEGETTKKKAENGKAFFDEKFSVKTTFWKDAKNVTEPKKMTFALNLFSKDGSKKEKANSNINIGEFGKDGASGARMIVLGDAHVEIFFSAVSTDDHGDNHPSPASSPKLNRNAIAASESSLAPEPKKDSQWKSRPKSMEVSPEAASNAGLLGSRANTYNPVSANSTNTPSAPPPTIQVGGAPLSVLGALGSQPTETSDTSGSTPSVSSARKNSVKDLKDSEETSKDKKPRRSSSARKVSVSEKPETPKSSRKESSADKQRKGSAKTGFVESWVHMASEKANVWFTINIKSIENIDNPQGIYFITWRRVSSSNKEGLTGATEKYKVTAEDDGGKGKCALMNEKVEFSTSLFKEKGKYKKKEFILHVKMLLEGLEADIARYEVDLSTCYDEENAAGTPHQIFLKKSSSTPAIALEVTASLSLQKDSKRDSTESQHEAVAKEEEEKSKEEELVRTEKQRKAEEEKKREEERRTEERRREEEELKKQDEASKGKRRKESEDRKRKETIEKEDAASKAAKDRQREQELAEERRREAVLLEEEKRKAEEEKRKAEEEKRKEEDRKRELERKNEEERKNQEQEKVQAITSSPSDAPKYEGRELIEYPSSGMKRTPNFTFKVIVVGDSGVGKTNILNRYNGLEFDYSTVSTIGVNLWNKVYTRKADDKVINCAVWDTAGQERFRSIIQSYYRGTNGVVLVYDITRLKSLENLLDYWMKEISEANEMSNLTLMLVGNKADLDAERQVTQARAEQAAKQLKAYFLETSALSNLNIHKAFETLVLEMLKKNSANSIFQQGGSMSELALKNSVQISTQPAAGEAGYFESCGC